MKNFLPSFKTIDAGAMTGNITSAVTDIRFLDNVSIQLVWTGTPTGTFAVQGSVDYSPGNSLQGRAPDAGTWTPITLSASVAAAGSADNALIDMNQLSFPYIRVVYTFGSGTGTLNGWVSGKAV